MLLVAIIYLCVSFGIVIYGNYFMEGCEKNRLTVPIVIFTSIFLLPLVIIYYLGPIIRRL